MDTKTISVKDVSRDLFPYCRKLLAVLPECPLREGISRVVHTFSDDDIFVLVNDKKRSTAYLSLALECIQVIDMKMALDINPEKIWEVATVLMYLKAITRLEQLLEVEMLCRESSDSDIARIEAFREQLIPPPKFILGRDRTPSDAWQDTFLRKWGGIANNAMASYVVTVTKPGIGNNVRTLFPHWLDGDILTLHIWAPPGLKYPAMYEHICKHLARWTLSPDDPYLCTELACNAYIPEREYTAQWWRVWCAEVTDPANGRREYMNELRRCMNINPDEGAPV